MTVLKRVISGIILFAFVISIFIFGGYFLAAGALAVSLLGFWELSKAFAHPRPAEGEDRSPLPAKKKFDYMDALGLVGIVGYYACMVYFSSPIYQFVVVALFVLSLLFVYVCSFPKVPIERISNLVFSFIYCPVMISFAYMTREAEGVGKYLIWMILISSWGCDTCAYIVGMAIGKKRIFPLLSPKKSLEGCIGGIVGCGILGGLYGYFCFGKYGGYLEAHPHIYIFTAIICMFGGVVGIMGDLVASGIKRNKGFKDYAKLIPGHGGIMDRIDSTIPTAPAVYFLSLLILEGYLKL